jgi:hypothetical protein
VNGVLAIRISTDRMLYATGLLDLAVDHDGTRRNSQFFWCHGNGFAASTADASKCHTRC